MSAGARPPASPPRLPELAQTIADSLEAAGALLLDGAGRRAAAESSRAAATGPGATVVAGSRRDAAVLVLFGPGSDGLGDVVLLERAAGLRAHPGQVAFPGGGLDDADAGDPVAAALREAREEACVDPAGVRVLGLLPAVAVPPGGRAVTPVVAWADDRGELAVGDPREVARVLRVPVGDLTDPGARYRARTSRGWTGPAFALGELLVWGFTGVVLAALLRACDLDRPWDERRVIDVPARFAGGAGHEGRPGSTTAGGTA